MDMLPFNAPVESVSASEILSATPRPEHTAMCSRRIQPLLGREMRHWKDALRNYLISMKYIEA
jgi:hypothetical protein